MWKPTVPLCELKQIGPKLSKSKPALCNFMCVPLGKLCICADDFDIYIYLHTYVLAQT